ncbi:putative ribonuclease H-like domain-containing protein [Tanacetum coccineum]|uniref:Ribonuclease H-like domain-containing protein n=1 Tax=Tanacetum coccineum TaxID=301880 RepID=A0ABQ5J906_9ASTR
MRLIMKRKWQERLRFRNKGLFNTGMGYAKPVMDKCKQVKSIQINLVPRSVLLKAGRPNTKSLPNINTVEQILILLGPGVNLVHKADPSPVKLGYKDSWRILKNSNGGSVTFGGSKGYISGKGKIRVGNLDFDSVSFVKELGILTFSQYHKYVIIAHKVPKTSQICDSFDMKTLLAAKGFALSMSKMQTSDESKLWHRRLENQHIIGLKSFRSDNGMKFKNRNMLEFCGNNGIKQEYSNDRTPQQNGVAERMNKTLIEAARTMLADSLLPTTFWAEAVSTACYIFNRKFYNYIPVSLENQANPHAGTSEATNNASTSQTPNSNASEEKDEDIELIVVPSAIKITEEKVESRTSSINLKKEEILTDPQQEKKVYFDEHLMMKEGEITDFNSLPLEIEKAKCSKNQELMLFSAIFKSSKEKITKINNIVCLLVFYLMRNLKKIAEALQDDSWVQAMQEELLQFKLQQVVKALYGLHQAPRAWYATLSTFLEKHGYKRDEFYGRTHIFLGLQVKQNKAGIFISQDKYVAEILKKFDLVNVKTAITPMETKVALTKDEEAIDVDVTPKTSHLNAVKRIFKYLKGKLHLAYGILENHLLTWKHSLTVIMVGSTLTGNPKQVVVNFLDKDLSYGNARNRP